VEWLRPEGTAGTGVVGLRRSVSRRSERRVVVGRPAWLQEESRCHLLHTTSSHHCRDSQGTNCFLVGVGLKVGESERARGASRQPYSPLCAPPPSSPRHSSYRPLHPPASRFLRLSLNPRLGVSLIHSPSRTSNAAPEVVLTWANPSTSLLQTSLPWPPSPLLLLPPAGAPWPQSQRTSCASIPILLHPPPCLTHLACPPPASAAHPPSFGRQSSIIWERPFPCANLPL